MSNENGTPTTAPDPGDRRIVVVGPCASGKTTLVDALRERGHDAYAVAQEHSIIRDLWSRRDPDVVIALDLDLETLRQRRSPTWSETVYAAQRMRLREAFEHADLVIDTGAHDVESMLIQSVRFLEQQPGTG